jgi:hypothetical protein
MGDGMVDKPDFEDEPPVWWPKPEELPIGESEPKRVPGGWEVTSKFASRAAYKNFEGFLGFIGDPKNRAQIEADIEARPKWAARLAMIIKRGGRT